MVALETKRKCRNIFIINKKKYSRLFFLSSPYLDVGIKHAFLEHSSVFFFFFSLFVYLSLKIFSLNQRSVKLLCARVKQ